MQGRTTRCFQDQSIRLVLTDPVRSTRPEEAEKKDSSWEENGDHKVAARRKSKQRKSHSVHKLDRWHEVNQRLSKFASVCPLMCCIYHRHASHSKTIVGRGSTLRFSRFANHSKTFLLSFKGQGGVFVTCDFKWLVPTCR